MPLCNGLAQQISTRFFTGALELLRVEFANKARGKVQPIADFQSDG